MDKELDELIEKQKQLEGMQQSLHDFSLKLKAQQDEFFLKHLGYSKTDKNISIFDMIKRATKSKLVL